MQRIGLHFNKLQFMIWPRKSISMKILSDFILGYLCIRSVKL